MSNPRQADRWIIAVVTLWVGLENGQAAGPDTTPIRTPTGGAVVDVDFDRHVASLLGRLGCNSAACHGSFQGKGGLRLSLFGQSPAADFDALVGDRDEPRVNCQSPDESLVLIKATGGDEHGGGIRIQKDSWEYQILRRWIATGARRDPDRGAIVRLVVEPREIPPLKPGQACGLNAKAQFRDGSREDLTAFTEFRSQDDRIAVVGPGGEIQARAAGATFVIASYRGAFASVPVFVPYPVGPPPLERPPTESFIDDQINAQLASLNLSPSPRADDAEFVRRVYLDVIGLIPTVEQVDRFLRDDDPHKRTKLIEWLLNHPRRASAWATRLCDMTACNVEHLGSPEELRPRRAKMWHDWCRRRIADNLPYDQLVRGVVCAVSRRAGPVDKWLDDEIALEQSARAGFESAYANRPDLDLYWRRVGPQGVLPVEDLAELTASAFLGLRLHCARCHQHPYDHWTQSDFAGFANIFARVEFGSSTELRLAVAQRLEQRRESRRAGTALPDFPRVQEVFLATQPRELVDAASVSQTPPRPPGGEPIDGSGDAREALLRWLTHPDNPYFAANIVNRVWAHYFGAGLVEPVDGFSAANPAAHPKSLRRLADEFVRSGYDLQQLERWIVNSEAYQRTSRPTGNNADDVRQLSHARMRVIPAAVLVDSLNQALETTDDFGPDVRPGSQALEIAVNQFSNPDVQSMFRVLGRADRKALCECESATGPSVRRALFTLSDPRVLAKIPRGRVARLVTDDRSDSDIATELYLATLSRPPTDDERAFCLRHVAGSPSRGEGWTDVVWAILNSREFLTNH